MNILRAIIPTLLSRYAVSGGGVQDMEEGGEGGGSGVTVLCRVLHNS